MTKWLNSLNESYNPKKNWNIVNLAIEIVTMNKERNFQSFQATSEMTHIIDYTGEIKPKKKSIWNYVLWTMMISNRNNIVTLIRRAAIRFHLDEYALCSKWKPNLYFTSTFSLCLIITIFSAWQIIPMILCFDSVNRVKFVYTSISPSFILNLILIFMANIFRMSCQRCCYRAAARMTFFSLHRISTQFQFWNW